MGWDWLRAAAGRGLLSDESEYQHEDVQVASESQQELGGSSRGDPATHGSTALSCSTAHAVQHQHTTCSADSAATRNAGEMKGVTMAENQSHLDALRHMLQRPGNRDCADCCDGSAAGRSSWASINLGVFICLRCAGVHRGLGVHISKVRSCTLDTWLKEQVDFMERTGNQAANQFFEARMPPGTRPTRVQSAAELQSFIRRKYEAREWADPHATWPPPQARAAAPPATAASAQGHPIGVQVAVQNHHISPPRVADRHADPSPGAAGATAWGATQVPMYRHPSATGALPWGSAPDLLSDSAPSAATTSAAAAKRGSTGGTAVPSTAAAAAAAAAIARRKQHAAQKSDGGILTGVGPSGLRPALEGRAPASILDADVFNPAAQQAPQQQQQQQQQQIHNAQFKQHWPDMTSSTPAAGLSGPSPSFVADGYSAAAGAIGFGHAAEEGSAPLSRGAASKSAAAALPWPSSSTTSVAGLAPVGASRASAGVDRSAGAGVPWLPAAPAVGAAPAAPRSGEVNSSAGAATWLHAGPAVGGGGASVAPLAGEVDSSAVAAAWSSAKQRHETTEARLADSLGPTMDLKQWLQAQDVRIGIAPITPASSYQSSAPQLLLYPPAPQQQQHQQQQQPHAPPGHLQHPATQPSAAQQLQHTAPQQQPYNPPQQQQQQRLLGPPLQAPPLQAPAGQPQRQLPPSPQRQHPQQPPGLAVQAAQAPSLLWRPQQQLPQQHQPSRQAPATWQAQAVLQPQHAPSQPGPSGWTEFRDQPQPHSAFSAASGAPHLNMTSAPGYSQGAAPAMLQRAGSAMGRMSLDSKSPTYVAQSVGAGAAAHREEGGPTYPGGLDKLLVQQIKGLTVDSLAPPPKQWSVTDHHVAYGVERRQ